MTKIRRTDHAGIGLMTLGVLFVAAAGLLLGYNTLYLEKQAAETTRYVQQILQQEVIPDAFMENIEIREMQSVEIDGVFYIGILELPTLGLSLPVGKDFSYDLLQQNVCRYAGSCLEDNMIIAGHNYRCHFQKISTLTPGDEVIFIDVTGKRFRYVVDKIETLEGTDGDALPWEQPGLTLFTCTYSGRSRYVVRCSLAVETAQP